MRSRASAHAEQEVAAARSGAEPRRSRRSCAAAARRRRARRPMPSAQRCSSWRRAQVDARRSGARAQRQAVEAHPRRRRHEAVADLPGRRSPEREPALAVEPRVGGRVKLTDAGRGRRGAGRCSGDDVGARGRRQAAAGAARGADRRGAGPAAPRATRRLSRRRRGYARARSRRAPRSTSSGLTVDEALPRLDKLLDEAALADRNELRVIHGFGAGRLRAAVAGLLEGHPHVAVVPRRARARRRRRRHRRGAEGIDGLSRRFVEEVRRTADIVRLHLRPRARSRRWARPGRACARSTRRRRRPSTCARAAGLPLLRLRRGRRRLQVRDAAREASASRRRSRCVARRFGVPVPEDRVRAGAGPQGARARCWRCWRPPPSTSRADLGRRRAPGRASTCWAAASSKETLERIRAGAARESLGRPAREPAATRSR